MLKAEWWGWAKVWLYEVVMAVKGGSTRSSFGRRGISQVVQGHVQVASWAAAWAHAELSTPPKTYLAFLVLAVPSSWYIWLSLLGSRALYHPRDEGGQTKEVEAKKRLGGVQEEMLPVFSLFCGNSEMLSNHDVPGMVLVCSHGPVWSSPCS